MLPYNGVTLIRERLLLYYLTTPFHRPPPTTTAKNKKLSFLLFSQNKFAYTQFEASHFSSFCPPFAPHLSSFCEPWRASTEQDWRTERKLIWKIRAESWQGTSPSANLPPGQSLAQSAAGNSGLNMQPRRRDESSSIEMARSCDADIHQLLKNPIASEWNARSHYRVREAPKQKNLSHIFRHSQGHLLSEDWGDLPSDLPHRFTA
jgi:hypothetical protein